jgi:hypothetical protein
MEIVVPVEVRLKRGMGRRTSMGGMRRIDQRKAVSIWMCQVKGNFFLKTG